MFRPVSVELWLSDKKQVKSCFNHIHDALLQFLLVLTKSFQITRFYGRKSEFRNVLAIMFRCVCVLPSPRSYTCIVTFDRKGVNILIVSSFSHYVVELEYLDRLGRKLEGVMYFILAYAPS